MGTEKVKSQNDRDDSEDQQPEAGAGKSYVVRIYLASTAFSRYAC